MTFLTGRCTFILLLGASLLSSCGSLLGGDERADLFRFGVADLTPVPAAQGALPGPSVSLLRSRFPQEIEGDRILTTRGARALYVKNARWVAPVPDLFTQALVREFASRSPDVRLADAKGATKASYALQIVIERFEANYDVDGDGKTPPTVIIEGDATFFDLTDRHAVASSRFSVEEPASTNTTSGIVAAFDRGVVRYTEQLTDWSLGVQQRHAGAGS